MRIICIMNKKAKIDLYKRVCKEISRRKTGNAYEFLSVNTEILNNAMRKYQKFMNEDFREIATILQKE